MAFGYDPAATFGAGFAILALALSLWEIIWKGFGMWRAARNGHKIWFVAILVFNTLGILPIVYYFFFSGRQAPQQTAEQPKLAAKARKKR